MSINPSSPNWGGTSQPGPAGVYADGLIPFADPATGDPITNANILAAPFSGSSGNNQVIWVDVYVPVSASNGTYTGTLTVTTSQGNVTVPMTLTVWNFTLPVKPALQSSFLFWNGNNNTFINEQELLKNRLMPVSVQPASNESALMNLNGLSATNMGMFGGADASNCAMSAAPSVAQFQALAAGHAPGLTLYDYSADEIYNCSTIFPTIQQWARNMHQAGINNLVTVPPIPALYSDGSGSGRSAVDIWVELPMSYNAADVAYVKNKGDQVWSYNAVVQDDYSPKWLIDFSPIQMRIQPGFINESLGMTGLLYWAIDLWSAGDPWVNPNNTGTFSPGNYPGEGVLVYPGADVGLPTHVIPTMRLKELRDGAEDFDYIEILKSLGQGAWALQMANSVGKNWTQWTQDPNVLLSVRDQLGQKIDQLNGGNATDTAPPSAPPNLAATAIASNQINLSWTAATDNVGVAGYNVFRCQGAACTPVTQIASVTSGTSYQDTTLSAATSYGYAVFAYDAAGNTSGSSVTSAATPAVANNHAPVLISATPSSGAGATQTFSLVYNDPDGFADLDGVNLVINTTSGRASACAVHYNAGNNQLSLADDAAASWSSAILGVPGTLSNSQCAIHMADSSVVGAGNQLTLNVPITFAAAFAGSKTIYMWGIDRAGSSVGYTAMGTWDIPSGAIDTIPPSILLNLTASAVSSSRINLSWTASTDNVGVAGYNVFRCQGTTCTPVTQIASVTSGTLYQDTNLSVGTSYVYAVSAYDAAGNTSAPSAASATTAAAFTNHPPTLVSAIPNSGTGVSQIFSLIYNDPDGFINLSNVNAVINTTSARASACALSYDAGSHQLSLSNDAAGSWVSAPLGLPGTLSNSQCAVNMAGSSAVGVGNHLTLNVALTFSASFAGPKTIYMWDADQAGSTAGYTAMGAWTVPQSSSPVNVPTSDVTTAIKVYPNPWRGDRYSAHPFITFSGASAGATIKIFTVSGHEVKALRADGANGIWDLTNDSGDKVGSGLYNYLVTTSQGQNVRGIVAVIR